jgi:hypothetical protein
MAVQAESLQPFPASGGELPAPRESHHGRPFSEMEAIIAEMEALRDGSVLPHEDVEALLEEHRREFGRA